MKKSELRRMIREEISINEGQTDIMKIPLSDAKKIIAEYEALRRLGQYNMFDFLAVQRLAFENKLYNLVNFTQNNKRAYASILKNYDKLIRLIKKKDIPKIKKLKTKYTLESNENSITEVNRRNQFWSVIRKELIKKFGNDPLYREVIESETTREMKKNLDTLKSIRGPQAVSQLMNYARKMLAKHRVRK